MSNSVEMIEESNVYKHYGEKKWSFSSVFFIRKQSVYKKLH